MASAGCSRLFVVIRAIIETLWKEGGNAVKTKECVCVCVFCSRQHEWGPSGENFLCEGHKNTNWRMPRAPTSLHVLQVEGAALLFPEATEKQHLLPIMDFHWQHRHLTTMCCLVQWCVLWGNAPFAGKVPQNSAREKWILIGRRK